MATSAGKFPQALDAFLPVCRNCRSQDPEGRNILFTQAPRIWRIYEMGGEPLSCQDPHRVLFQLQRLPHLEQTEERCLSNWSFPALPLLCSASSSSFLFTLPPPHTELLCCSTYFLRSKTECEGMGMLQHHLFSHKKPLGFKDMLRHFSLNQHWSGADFNVFNEHILYYIVMGLGDAALSPRKMVPSFMVLASLTTQRRWGIKVTKQ